MYSKFEFMFFYFFSFSVLPFSVLIEHYYQRFVLKCLMKNKNGVDVQSKVVIVNIKRTVCTVGFIKIILNIFQLILHGFCLKLN